MSRVTVFVDRDVLQRLKDNGFNLCLTRDVKVGEKVFKGNVVFATVPAEYLAPSVQLKWEDEYQVFETKSYMGGVKVTAGTKFVDIKLGQLATFDITGNGKVTGKENRNKPLGVRNEWKEDARAGIRSYDPSTDDYHSFFLSPEIPVDRTIELTPTKRFTIFWSPYLATDTIIDDVVSDSYEFEIIGDEITLKYSAERPHWSRV